jgi:FAD/FMN-containing dehydrogenase/Fe-S oxidoreductase
MQPSSEAPRFGTYTRREPPELSSPEVDARALQQDLSASVEGEVRFDTGSRALYANDASIYRQAPIGVVVPKGVEDVVATVAACRRHGAPIFGRGTGTGLAGQSVNAAVLIDFTKYMNEILELDPENRFARVQPGIILDTLRNAAEEYDLTFGPDPATHSRCTLGGMIGNNSCGTHSILAGLTSDNIEALDVLLYDGTRLTVESGVSDGELERIIREGGRKGEIYQKLKDLRDRYADLIRERYPQIPRRVSGYNLDALLPEKGFNVAAALVGTESTCALVLEARCKLIPSPQYRSLIVLGYEDGPAAADHATEMLEYDPIAVETFDRRLVDNELKKGFKRHPELLPEGDGWLLVEFGGDSEEEVDEKARRLTDAMEGSEQFGMRLYEDPTQKAEVWEIREGGVGHSKIPGEHAGWPSWEDAAVAPERIGDYLRDLEELCDKHGLRVAALFGHVGHGCVHSRINWDFSTAEGVRTFRRFMEDAGDLVTKKYGGSLSGEHGDGQARAELLPKMVGEEIVGAFREFKAIWDPQGKMNPGKVVGPYPLDSNLRISPSYRTRSVETHFQFPDDGGSFAEATERCFGVGACRQLGGATMCPSFMVTREEKHSTRGRARMLFEMMHASQLKDGWRDESVKESLDLCLACKGCKHDCPVRVDMASYKAEFLSHYYEGRLRPVAAYALGLIYWESRLASLTPGLANFFTQTPGISGAAKRLAGIAPQRETPAFASRTFRRWFAGRRALNENGPRVILWPDTFTNHFEPEVGRAAVEVLEAAGYSVELPRGGPLCCGRPLYDYGMLELAKRQLRQILDRMRPEIEAGIPVVGLEPSCAAVFRDELINLFPHDEDAKRLARQTFGFAEFLIQDGYVPPVLEGRALLHGHCHQKAIFGMQSDSELLEKLGLDYESPATGCCGLAGSFGYEAGDNYDVSVKAGERVLLPAVRKAAKDALIITDGFSCRTQIASGTDRRALHLSQVLQMALRDGGGSLGDYPESEYFEQKQMRPGARSAALLAGAALGGGAVAWGLKRRFG